MRGIRAAAHAAKACADLIDGPGVRSSELSCQVTLLDAQAICFADLPALDGKLLLLTDPLDVCVPIALAAIRSESVERAHQPIRI